jgi:hypothetical protein
MLYGEHLADLEDLKAYVLTGRHPKEDLKRVKQALGHTESLVSSRLSDASSFTNPV